MAITIIIHVPAHRAQQKWQLLLLFRVPAFRAQQKWQLLLLLVFPLFALNKSGNLFGAQAVPRLSVLN